MKTTHLIMISFVLTVAASLVDSAPFDTAQSAAQHVSQGEARP